MSRRCARSGLKLVIWLACQASLGVTVGGEEIARVAFQDRLAQLYGARSIQLLRFESFGRDQSFSRHSIQMVVDTLGDSKRLLMRFTSPASLRDLSMLYRETGKGKSEIFLYVPSLKSTRRLVGIRGRESLFGTALTHFDLDLQSHEAFDVDWGESGYEDCGAPIVLSGREDDLPYSRIVSCADPETGAIAGIRFMDGGAVVRKISVDPRDILTSGDRLTASQFEVADLVHGVRTTVHRVSIWPVPDVPQVLFTLGNLREGGVDKDRVLLDRITSEVPNSRAFVEGS